jgi:hypothetical protein
MSTVAHVLPHGGLDHRQRYPGAPQQSCQRFSRAVGGSARRVQYRGGRKRECQLGKAYDYGTVLAVPPSSIQRSIFRLYPSLWVYSSTMPLYSLDIDATACGGSALRQSGLAGRRGGACRGLLSLATRRCHTVCPTRLVLLDLATGWEKCPGGDDHAARGTGLYWEVYSTEGFHPQQQQTVHTTRRRLKIDLERPMKDGYAQLLRDIMHRSRIPACRQRGV